MPSVTAANIPVRQSRTRDGRLDVLRGLCLINMVIVHLIEQGLVVPTAVNEVMMHWFRFAAGGFIFASGLCVGAIHYQKALDPEKRFGVYLSLLKRAGLVLLVHYFATFLSLLMVPLSGYHEYSASQYIRDVLFLWTGYDLLLFYVVMLLASPVLIELTRRFGVTAVAVGSGGLFFLWYDSPYLPLYGIENHFPVIRWQAVFVFGLLAGARLPAFDAMTRGGKQWLLAGAAGLAIGVALLSTLERYDGWVVPWWLTVTKYPLSPLEVVRYLAIVLAIGIVMDLYWNKVHGTRAESVVGLLGAQTLLLWVVHVPIVANLVTLNWILAITLSILGVWLAAWVGMWLARQWQNGITALPRLAYAAPVLGTLMVLSLLVNMQGNVQMADTAPAAQETVLLGDTIEDQPLDLSEPLDPIPMDEDSVLEMA